MGTSEFYSGKATDVSGRCPTSALLCQRWEHAVLSLSLLVERNTCVRTEFGYRVACGCVLGDPMAGIGCCRNFGTWGSEVKRGSQWSEEVRLQHRQHFPVAMTDTRTGFDGLSWQVRPTPDDTGLPLSRPMQVHLVENVKRKDEKYWLPGQPEEAYFCVRVRNRPVLTLGLHGVVPLTSSVFPFLSCCVPMQTRSSPVFCLRCRAKVDVFSEFIVSLSFVASLPPSVGSQAPRSSFVVSTERCQPRARF